MRLFLRKKGQSTAEYAILIGLVIGVLVVMQTYVKRGIHGRLKDASDDFQTKMGDTSKGDKANWDAITATTATMSPHYEFDKYSGKRTRETLATTKTTEGMVAGGGVTREVKDVTKDEEGDYTFVDY